MSTSSLRPLALVTGASTGIGLESIAVTVTALMPGPTDTEFFETADMLDTKVGADEKDRKVAEPGSARTS